MKSVIIDRALRGKFVLIGEIGVNYYDIALKYSISPMLAAKMMIVDAQSAGVHAVKFQSYKASKLAVKDSPSYWDRSEEPTASQYELFSKFDGFDYNDYKELSEFCSGLGIEFLSTPFDFEAADYLDSLMNVYKISSSDLTNTPLIKHIAKKNKPILLSIGASNKDEVDNAVRIIRNNNSRELVLLHCVLEYPTPYSHANLNRISTLKTNYPEAIVGYSDHTKPDANFDLIKTAYSLGALIVEKHFTSDKKLVGNDHYHSIDYRDACKIIEEIEFLDLIKGSKEIKSLESESSARINARRSIVANVDIKAGEIINEKMLTFKRPGSGISPDRMQDIIGKIAKYDIYEDTIIKFDMLR